MAHPQPTSIYKARFERPFNDDDVTHSARHGDTRKPSRPPAVTQGSSRGLDAGTRFGSIPHKRTAMLTRLRTGDTCRQNRSAFAPQQLLQTKDISAF
jgi:hypothetical protein